MASCVSLHCPHAGLRVPHPLQPGLTPPILRRCGRLSIPRLSRSSAWSGSAAEFITGDLSRADRDTRRNLGAVISGPTEWESRDAETRISNLGQSRSSSWRSTGVVSDTPNDQSSKPSSEGPGLMERDVGNESLAHDHRGGDRHTEIWRREPPDRNFDSREWRNGEEAQWAARNKRAILGDYSRGGGVRSEASVPSKRDWGSKGEKSWSWLRTGEGQSDRDEGREFSQQQGENTGNSSPALYVQKSEWLSLHDRERGKDMRKGRDDYAMGGSESPIGGEMPKPFESSGIQREKNVPFTSSPVQREETKQSLTAFLAAKFSGEITDQPSTSYVDRGSNVESQFKSSFEKSRATIGQYEQPISQQKPGTNTGSPPLSPGRPSSLWQSERSSSSQVYSSSEAPVSSSGSYTRPESRNETFLSRTGTSSTHPPSYEVPFVASPSMVSETPFNPFSNPPSTPNLQTRRVMPAPRGTQAKDSMDAGSISAFPFQSSAQYLARSTGSHSIPSRPSIPGKFSKYSQKVEPKPAYKKKPQSSPASTATPLSPTREMDTSSLPTNLSSPSASHLPADISDISGPAPSSSSSSPSKDDAAVPLPRELPFEYQFSYTETPKMPPVGYREPPYSPFGPTTMPRPWTGRAPLNPSKKKLPEFDSFVLPPKNKKGVKPVQAPGPYPEGQTPKQARTREDVIGEPLTTAEVKELIESSCHSNRQINLGRDGLTHNMLDLIHTHWKRRRCAKVKCKGVPTVDMDNVCQKLEEKTGGKIIQRHGGVVYLFRGRNYNYKDRPRIPLMLWKPPAPIYPKLIQPDPGGLTKEVADFMRKRGKKLPPVCKLGKNGVYLNLVRDVKDAFEVDELVRVDCTGLNPSDYKKIGAKLRDLVPCVLLSFEKESILMWRGNCETSVESEDNGTCSTAASPLEEGATEESKPEASKQENVATFTALAEAVGMATVPEVGSQLLGPVANDRLGSLVAADASGLTSQEDGREEPVHDTPIFNNGVLSGDTGLATVPEVGGQLLGTVANDHFVEAGDASGLRSQEEGREEPIGDTLVFSNGLRSQQDVTGLAGQDDESAQADKATQHGASAGDNPYNVDTLWQEAIASGTALPLNEPHLDPDTLLEKVDAFSKICPAGPVRKVYTRTPKSMGKRLKQGKGSSNTDDLGIPLEAPPFGELAVDQLAKLLAS